MKTAQAYGNTTQYKEIEAGEGFVYGEHLWIKARGAPSFGVRLSDGSWQHFSGDVPVRPAEVDTIVWRAK